MQAAPPLPPHPRGLYRVKTHVFVQHKYIYLDVFV